MSGGSDLPTVPAARMDPVLRQYPLRRQRIPMGAALLSVVLPDDQKWMRKGSWVGGVTAGREPPYWVRVWPAAVALARQLVRAGDLTGARVLDLGCGIGIPGVVAAGLGANVCFVDREPHALAFASFNASRQPSCSGSVTVQEVDWSRQSVAGDFDLILLSDVSYHQSHHAPLRRQLDSCLADDGVVLHSDPERALAERFLEQLQTNMLQSRRVVHSHYRDLAARSDDRRVRIRIALASKSRSAQGGWLRRLGWPEALEPTEHDRS